MKLPNVLDHYRPPAAPTASDPVYPTETEGTMPKNREPTAWKPGQIIRAAAFDRGYRVWRVVAVRLGATNQEGVIVLEPLDLEPNGWGAVQVPCELLEAAMIAGELVEVTDAAG